VATERSGTQRLVLRAAGLASGWSILLPLLVFLPIFDSTEGSGLTAYGAGDLGKVLAVLLPVSALGVLGILATRLTLRGSAAGRVILTGNPIVLLALTIFTAATVGPFILAPAVLYIFPALWLMPEVRAGYAKPPQEGLR
jgi:hypothetical protein